MKVKNANKINDSYSKSYQTKINSPDLYPLVITEPRDTPDGIKVKSPISIVVYFNKDLSEDDSIVATLRSNDGSIQVDHDLLPLSETTKDKRG